jgi:hypothetical protein
MASVAEKVPLVPQQRVLPRLIVVAVLTVLAILTDRNLTTFVGVPLVAAGLLGTYPEIFVQGKELERRLRVLFVEVRVTRLSLDECTQIETDVEPSLGIGWAVFLGFWNWVWCHVLDRLVPWLGGDYRLWVRTYRGERIHVWQGNGETNFRANIEILTKESGLPLG